MRVLVVTSSPPFVEGGHLVIARELVRACRDSGHDADLVVTPQNRFGRQGAAYLASWLTDVGVSADGRAVDHVISLRYPGLRGAPSAPHLLAQSHHARVLRPVDAVHRAAVMAQPPQGGDAPPPDPRRRPALPDARRAAALRHLGHRAGAAPALERPRLDRAASAGSGPRLPLRGLRGLHLRGVAPDAAQALRPAARGAGAAGGQPRQGGHCR